MTPERLAQDPAVRAAVFATVTTDEAARVLRSRAGKPWCDAFMVRMCDGLAERLDPDEAEEMRASGRAVTRHAAAVREGVG
jgi:hypothetical protein